MARKIGNFILFICFSLFSIILAKQDLLKIDLNITDNSGTQLSNAGIGVPFFLQLTIEGNSTDFNNPVIENLDKHLINNRGVSTSISTMNGKTSIKKDYRYEVRIDKQGSYKFGPTHIAGNKYDNFASIEVKKDQKLKEQRNNFNEAFLKISVNDSKVFLNQEMELGIRFYYKQDINLTNLEFPDLKDFIITKEKSRDSGSEIINNEEFSYHEYKYLIYPKISGNLLIPSFKAYFDMPTLQRSIFGFFGKQFEQKEILSNVVSVVVLPLPPCKDTVNGIGSFKNFKVTLNQDCAFQDEGVVLKMEIEGKGNLENAKIDKLNLGSNIRYYDSRSYIEPINDSDFQKKMFEFILQSKEEGQIEIPEQKFVFFDPEKKIYQVLKSKPLDLTIQLFEKKLDVLKNNSYEIRPIFKHYKKIALKKSVKINRNYFILLMLLPFLLNFLVTIVLYFNKKILIRDFKIIRHSIKRISLAKKQNRTCDLYKIFTNYFSKKFQVSDCVISDEFIKSQLERNNFSPEIIGQWQNFFSKTVEEAFYTKDDKIDNKENLFKQAFDWINLFKKTL